MERSEEEEAAKAVVSAIQASEDAKAAEETFTATLAVLSANHRATTAEVDVLHLALEQSDDRTRRIRQRAPIKRAIIEVQVRAANQRNGTAEPEEGLCNDTVKTGWMPKLFNGMIGNDADPDVKRMALEAAERAHINQIYPDGASKQQWDAFIADYRIRQALWIRDHPGKTTGGTRRQPSAGAATPTGYEIGCTKHMRR